MVHSAIETEYGTFVELQLPNIEISLWLKSTFNYQQTSCQLAQNKKSYKERISFFNSL